MKLYVHSLVDKLKLFYIFYFSLTNPLALRTATFYYTIKSLSISHLKFNCSSTFKINKYKFNNYILQVTLFAFR